MVDFYCPAARLVVEVDGAQHGTPDGMRRDAERDAWLARSGVRVVRILASEVLRDPDAVAEWLVEQASRG